MIGNDIVDLALAQKESNWKRKGFVEKIFTAQEQLFINSAKNQEIMIWNLWSRKEAAYKIYNRQSGIRAYNPIQFECFDLDLDIGKVAFGNQVFYTQTTVTLEFIYTESVLKTEDFNKIKVLNNAIEIQKINGIPFYTNENLVISKTHHGRFERIITITSIPNAILV
jgi:phosphopantetheinyl transferase (holo-ACP synthase)